MTDRDIIRQGQCNTALGLLEAAMMLVNRATTEAPAVPGIIGSCAIINRHIEVLQRELVRRHDRYGTE